MPTGLTYGILNGKIKTFNEFAMLCIREFGAAIHMRDEDNDVPYRKREASDYHAKAVGKARKNLVDIENISDKDLIKEVSIHLKRSKRDHLKQIKTKKADKAKLEDMLKQAQKYTPPTSEHVRIKEMMIEQLTMTIDSDCDTDYNYKSLADIGIELDNLNADIIRSERIEYANRDIKYQLKQHKEELERCATSNKWAEDFINSLES